MQMYFSGVSEYICEGSAINNLHGVSEYIGEGSAINNLHAVSEYLGEGSAIINLHKSVSVVKISTSCELKNQNYKLQHQHLQMQHQHQLQGAAVKVGGVFLSPVAFQSKGRWLNHLEVHRPHCVKR